jgi:hypothetical protein
MYLYLWYNVHSYPVKKTKIIFSQKNCYIPRELRQDLIADLADVLMVDPLGHLRIISSPLVVS